MYDALCGTARPKWSQRSCQRCPWGKGTLVGNPGSPWWPQWVYLDLYQLLSWHRTEETHVSQHVSGRSTAFSDTVYRHFCPPPGPNLLLITPPPTHFLLCLPLAPKSLSVTQQGCLPFGSLLGHPSGAEPTANWHRPLQGC